MQKQQLYIQLLGNLIIPACGFWLWNWSLYFILLFYLLDLIAAEIVTYLKVKKVKQLKTDEQLKSPTSSFIIVSLLFLFLIITEFHVGIAVLHPTIDFKLELLNFLLYEEMGIQQWIVLLPMVGLMAFSSYKMEFLAPQLYLRLREKDIWKDHLKERFLILAFTAILLLIAHVYSLSDLVLLIVILVVTTIYGYLQGMEKIKNNRQVTP
ncbi:MAG: hypothetical protein M9916_07215 [Crocinitomicaceae bacterium]|nr:hypothetical protein [Crocinitomicaceae bacterium]